MDYKKEFYRVTCTWQTGETVYDRGGAQFELGYRDDVIRILRMKSRHKKDFNFWVEKITVTGQQIKDITL